MTKTQQEFEREVQELQRLFGSAIRKPKYHGRKRTVKISPDLKKGRAVRRQLARFQRNNDKEKFRMSTSKPIKHPAPPYLEADAFIILPFFDRHLER